MPRTNRIIILIAHYNRSLFEFFVFMDIPLYFGVLKSFIVRIFFSCFYVPFSSV